MFNSIWFCYKCFLYSPSLFILVCVFFKKNIILVYMFYNLINCSRFICKDTIEENIKALQDRKLKIAESVLTGSVSDKLTIEDLKFLFALK